MGSYYESYYNSAYNTTYNSDGTTTYYNSAYNTSTNDTYGATSYYNSAYSTNYNSDGSTSYYNSAYSTSYNDTYGATSYYNSAYSTSSGYSPSSDYSSYYYTDYYTSTYTPSSSTTYYSSYTPSYYSYSSTYSGSTYTPYSSSGYSSYRASGSSYSPSSSSGKSSSSYSPPSESKVGKIIGIIFACLIGLGMLSGLLTSIVSCLRDAAENKVKFSVEQVANGTLSISDEKLNTKDTLTLTATPSAGYFHAYTLVYYKGREESSNTRECADGDILVVFGNSFDVPFGGEAVIVPIFLAENDGSPIKIGREDIEYDAAYYFDGYYNSTTKNVYRNIYVYGLKSYLNKVAAGYSHVELIIEMDVAEYGTVTWEDSRFFGHQQTNSKQIITAFNFVNNVFSMEKDFALTYGEMDHAGDEVSDIYSKEGTTLKIATSRLTDQIYLGFSIDKSYGNTNGFDPTIAWKFKNFTLRINPINE